MVLGAGVCSCAAGSASDCGGAEGSGGSWLNARTDEQRRSAGQQANIGTRPHNDAQIGFIWFPDAPPGVHAGGLSYCTAPRANFALIVGREPAWPK